MRDILLFALTIVFLASLVYLVFAFIKKRPKKKVILIAAISFITAMFITPASNNESKKQKTPNKSLETISLTSLKKELEAAAFPAKVKIDKQNIIIELDGNFKNPPRFDFYFPDIGRILDAACKYDLKDFFYIIFDMKAHYEGTEKRLMKARFIISTICNTWKDLREKQKRNLGSSVYAIFNIYGYPSDIKIYDYSGFNEACYERPEIQAFCRHNKQQ